MGGASQWRFMGLCALGMSLAPTDVLASAWRADPRGSHIVAVAYGVRGETAISESSVFMEAQVSPRWDGIVTIQGDTWTSYGAADEDGVSAQQTGWRGEAAVALKTTLVEGSGYVVAGQGGLTYTDGSAELCGLGAEARVLGGFSYGPWFTDVQGAYRVLGNGCRNGKLDVTAGLRLGESWLALGQTFVDVASDRDPVIKLQLSAVRYDARGDGVQLGVRIRADEAGGEERALVVGWWKALTKAYQPRID